MDGVWSRPRPYTATESVRQSSLSGRPLTAPPKADCCDLRAQGLASDTSFAKNLPSNPRDDVPKPALPPQGLSAIPVSTPARQLIRSDSAPSGLREPGADGVRRRASSRPTSVSVAADFRRLPLAARPSTCSALPKPLEKDDRIASPPRENSGFRLPITSRAGLARTSPEFSLRQSSWRHLHASYRNKSHILLAEPLQRACHELEHVPPPPVIPHAGDDVDRVPSVPPELPHQITLASSPSSLCGSPVSVSHFSAASQRSSDDSPLSRWSYGSPQKRRLLLPCDVSRSDELTSMPSTGNDESKVNDASRATGQVLLPKSKSDTSMLQLSEAATTEQNADSFAFPGPDSNIEAERDPQPGSPMRFSRESTPCQKVPSPLCRTGTSDMFGFQSRLYEDLERASEEKTTDGTAPFAPDDLQRSDSETQRLSQQLEILPRGDTTTLLGLRLAALRNKCCRSTPDSMEPNCPTNPAATHSQVASPKPRPANASVAELTKDVAEFANAEDPDPGSIGSPCSPAHSLDGQCPLGSQEQDAFAKTQPANIPIAERTTVEGGFANVACLVPVIGLPCSPARALDGQCPLGLQEQVASTRPRPANISVSEVTKNVGDSANVATPIPVNIGSPCSPAHSTDSRCPVGFGQGVSRVWAPILGGRRHLKSADVHAACYRFRELRRTAGRSLTDYGLSNCEFDHVLKLNANRSEATDQLYNLLAEGGTNDTPRVDFRLLLVALAGLTKAKLAEQMRFAVLLLDEGDVGQLTCDQLTVVLHAAALLTAVEPQSRSSLEKKARALMAVVAGGADSVPHDKFIEIVRQRPGSLLKSPDETECFPDGCVGPTISDGRARPQSRENCSPNVELISRAAAQPEPDVPSLRNVTAESLVCSAELPGGEQREICSSKFELIPTVAAQVDCAVSSLRQVASQVTADDYLACAVGHPGGDPEHKRANYHESMLLGPPDLFEKPLVCPPCPPEPTVPPPPGALDPSPLPLPPEPTLPPPPNASMSPPGVLQASPLPLPPHPPLPGALEPSLLALPPEPVLPPPPDTSISLPGILEEPPLPLPPQPQLPPPPELLTDSADKNGASPTKRPPVPPLNLSKVKVAFKRLSPERLPTPSSTATGTPSASSSNVPCDTTKGKEAPPSPQPKCTISEHEVDDAMVAEKPGELLEFGSDKTYSTVLQRLYILLTCGTSKLIHRKLLIITACMTIPVLTILFADVGGIGVASLIGWDMAQDPKAMEAQSVMRAITIFLLLIACIFRLATGNATSEDDLSDEETDENVSDDDLDPMEKGMANGTGEAWTRDNQFEPTVPEKICFREIMDSFTSEREAMRNASTRDNSETTSLGLKSALAVAGRMLHKKNRRVRIQEKIDPSTPLSDTSSFQRPNSRAYRNLPIEGAAAVKAIRSSRIARRTSHSSRR